MTRTCGKAGNYRRSDGCRCDLCRAANTACAKEERATRRQRLLDDAAPEGLRHGIVTTYDNWTCRCDPCKAAKAKANAAGTARRRERNEQKRQGG